MQPKVTNELASATPGKTIDLLRLIGTKKGGKVIEGTKLVELRKEGKTYHALAKTKDNEYIEYITDVFINAMGPEAGNLPNN